MLTWSRRLRGLKGSIRMKHKMVAGRLRTRDALTETIREHEADGWSVAALGTTFGGERMVLVDDGNRYQHDIVCASWKSPEKMAATIAKKESEGWQVCAIGECFGCNLLILKRKLD